MINGRPIRDLRSSVLLSIFLSFSAAGIAHATPIDPFVAATETACATTST
jgi:hypothetical protein